MAHSEPVLARFNNPQHVLAESADATGRAGSRLAGSLIEIHLSRRNDLLQAWFRAYGCPATIASADYLCELINAADIVNDKLDRHVVIQGLELPASRQHCAALAIEAMQHALKALQEQ